MKRKRVNYLKPVLISFDAYGIDDIKSWVPDDPNEVSLWDNLTIDKDERAGDNFKVHI